jgi:hypothetical protein
VRWWANTPKRVPTSERPSFSNPDTGLLFSSFVLPPANEPNTDHFAFAVPIEVIEVMVCSYCGRSIDDKRRGTLYCSASCRGFAFRERRLAAVSAQRLRSSGLGPPWPG